MPSEKPKLPPQGPAPKVSLAELLRGHAELLIEHADAIYRLRLTRNGKLILTK
jgi:hemin uptake protein HemP